MEQLVAIVMAFALQANAVAPTEVERAALEARRQVVSGHLEFRYFHKSGSGKPVTTLFDCEFDGDRRFVKIVDEGDAELYPHSVTPKTTRYVKTPTTFMMHARENLEGGRRFAAFIDDLEQIELLKEQSPNLYGDVAVEHEMVFDPRLIGFLPDSIDYFLNKSLDSFVCGPRQSPATVEVTSVRDHPASHVSLLRPHGGQFQLWIDEKRGFVPVRMQFTTRSNGQTLDQVMEADLKQLPDADGLRWFPERMVYTLTEHTDSKSRIVEREEIQVITAKFNSRIDDSRFQLSALELPDKALIVHRPDPRESDGKPRPRIQKWDGEKALDLTPEDIEARRRSTAGLIDTQSPRPEWTLKRIIAWNIVGIGLFMTTVGIRRMIRRIGGQ